MLGIEDESVVDRDGGYLADQEEHMLSAVLNTVGGQIYVTRGSSRVQRGKKYAALQDESVCMR